MNPLDLTQAVQLTIKATQMYTDTHPKTQAALANLMQVFGRALTEKSAIHIAASNGKLFLDSAPMDAANIHANTLIKQLMERQIAGFVIHRGVTAEELLIVLKILTYKPAKIEEMGGPQGILNANAIRHITLSQTKYREITQLGGQSNGDEEGGHAVYLSKGLSHALGANLPKLVNRLTEGLQNLLSQDELLPIQGGKPRAIRPANLDKLLPIVDDLGITDPADSQRELSGEQQEALLQALNSLQSDTLFSIFAGIGSLPKGADNLAKALHDLSPQLISNAVVARMKAGSPWEPIQQQLFELLRDSPAQQAVIHSLDTNFHLHKIDARVLNALFRQLAWESTSLSDKVMKVSEGPALWDLIDEQKLEFLEELLRANRHSDFRNCLEQILQQLHQDPPRFRESAATVVGNVVGWTEKPGLPPAVEADLCEAMVAHFVWEPLSYILEITAASLSKQLSFEVARGQIPKAQELVQKLDNLCAFMAEPTPWRAQALAELKEHLLSPGLVALALNHLHSRKLDEDSSIDTIAGYFNFLGPKAAQSLMKGLEEESDGKKRKHLMELIHHLGEVAFPAIMEGLQSDRWYLVRNCLILLTDMGNEALLPRVSPFMNHPDIRVQRVAVRAVWKLGGEAAVSLLSEKLRQADPETQLEILFGLGQIKSPDALPVVHDMAKNSQVPLKLRIKAVEDIGSIGDSISIPLLLELLKRQGRIFSTAEPTELRVAAARALMAIGSLEAREPLARIVSDEPANKDQAALRQVMESSR